MDVNNLKPRDVIQVYIKRDENQKIDIDIWVPTELADDDPNLVLWVSNLFKSAKKPKEKKPANFVPSNNTFN